MAGSHANANDYANSYAQDLPASNAYMNVLANANSNAYSNLYVQDLAASNPNMNALAVSNAYSNAYVQDLANANAYANDYISVVDVNSRKRGYKKIPIEKPRWK